MSARTGAGIDELRAALDRAAAGARARGPTRRTRRRGCTSTACSRSGAPGTVVTGTLWSGEIGRGDELEVLPQAPAGPGARRPGPRPAARAGAGGPARGREPDRAGGGRDRARRRARRAPTRGCARATASTPSSSSPASEPEHGDARADPPRHARGARRGWPGSGGASGRSGSSSRSCPPPATGSWCGRSRRRTRSAAASCSTRGPAGTARAATCWCGSSGWRAAKRRNRPDDAAPPSGRRDPHRPTDAGGAGPTAQPARTLSASAHALEQRLRDAGVEPPIDSELDAGDLAALRDAGRAVRVSKSLHYHVDALADIRARLIELARRNGGAVTLAQLRDELGTSRKFAQALLEHFDSEKVTIRRGDEHVLRRRSAG